MWPLFDSPEDKAKRQYGATLWGVAVHEAAHAVVGGALGATGQSIHIASDGRSGHMTDEFGGPPELDAVISMAGDTAMRNILGRSWGGQHDAHDARRSLRGTGVSLGEARRDAARLVRHHRREIITTAQQVLEGHNGS